MRRIADLLASRKLAAALIAAVVVYSIIATLVPQEGVGNSADVERWVREHPGAELIVGAAGLHTAYSSPVFLALMALLTASTAVCAWERTKRSLVVHRRLAVATDAEVERLKLSFDAVVPLPAGLRAESALRRIESELRGGGLRTRRQGGMVNAAAGRIGLLGSPLFHWSLVALVFVVGTGRATRSEGFMALPTSQRVAEAHDSYPQIIEGPLFAERHTGVEFELSRVDRHYTQHGVDYGPIPLVVAYRDGVEIARGWVRPNDPLRTGNLMVHMADFGPAVTLAVEASGAGEKSRRTFTLDRSTTTTAGTVPQEFTVGYSAREAPLKVRVRVLVRRGAAARTAARVSEAVLETTTVDSKRFGPPIVVREFEALTLPDGSLLRVASVSDWVRVSVANDWSVPYIYALLVLIIIGLALAVLVPARRASVVLVEGAEGEAFHVATWHSRRDPLFRPMVVEAVGRAASEGDK